MEKERKANLFGEDAAPFMRESWQVSEKTGMA
jgi:hypothetical protein